VIRRDAQRPDRLLRTVVGSIWPVLMAALAYGAEPNLRFAKTLQIPGSWEVVVVAEGDFEPRTIGSYALRVYGGTSTKFPLDDFVAGVIRPRNGIIEAVRFESIDGDAEVEIVVVIRSAGSGGYLSADAFRYRAGSLELVASVADLDKAADPIRALRVKFGTPGADRTAPHS
jgi:PliI/PliC-like inhibitor of I-type lysozyme